MNPLFDSAFVDHTYPSHSGDKNAPYRVLTPEAFAEAEQAICAWPNYTPTPLHALNALASACGVAEILYKDEAPRFGLGSFKALGGAYAAQQLIRREIEQRTGQAVSLTDVSDKKYAEVVKDIHIVTATDGNHGRSVAWGTQLFGAACHIYIHAEVSEGRKAAMEAYGAEVIRVAGNYDDSVRAAQQAADENDWFVVSDTSYPGYTLVPSQVMAGYGVMAFEIVQQLKHSTPPSHVVLQGGVGGLAAAVSARLVQAWGDKAPRVVVVEPQLADCLFVSAQAGALQEVDIQEETLMAGLSCGVPSMLAWEILHTVGSDYVRLPEPLVAASMQQLAHPMGDDPKIVAGESATAGLSCVMAAAAQLHLKEKLGLTADSRVLLIGSEGATDADIYQQLVGEAP